jgi:hypothetical protein
MRLMLWNIQTFAKKKILNTTGKTYPEQILNYGLSQNRVRYLARTVGSVNPDVIVVLEVRSGSGKLGSLASAGGATASAWLLDLLRTGGEPWFLVPPLKLVDAKLDQKPHTEAISMYFRGDKLDFIGPLGWPKNTPQDGIKIPINPGGVLGPYDEPFNKALPEGNYFAGLPTFPTNEGELLFPGESNRRPFLCRFKEKAGFKRTLTIAASHPSPGVLPKTSSARLIGWVPKPAAGEVQVFPGDFNVNQLNGDVFYLEMEMLYGVKSNFPATAGPTSLLEVKDAKVTKYLSDYSIDNILTRYGTGTAPPNPNNAYIVNLVSGVPDVFASAMEIKLNQYGIYGELADEFFRLSNNYGKIAHYTGVSDHMALMLDI